MPTLEFILRSEATKDLAPKVPERTISANRASCGEFAAVDDARGASEGLVRGHPLAGADRSSRVAESAASAGSTDGADPARVMVDILYRAEKTRLRLLMFALSFVGPRV